jgi:multicomponent Na+:H+ antiporter subunit D
MASLLSVFDLSGAQALLIALLAPLMAAALIPLAHRWPNVREAVTLIAAAVLAWTVWSLAPLVMSGAGPEFEVGEIAAGLSLAFAIEPLGMVFALVAGSLWFVNSVYSIGYMRGNHEPRQTTFYVCFAIALFAAMGIAFAANLFTLFIFYELLTISTYPLVTHKATPEARQGGRTYLLYLLGTSMVFLLPAMVATYAIAGTLDFEPGGILQGKTSAGVSAILLVLFIFGIGKAAVMPFHGWLPTAMVAPTPVSALLHAVAVVKAGVFSVLKVVTYIFGLDAVSGNIAQPTLVAFAIFTLVAASVVALGKDNLKARLAYSTVSQLAYIVLGALIATSLTVTGGAMHIAMHAAAKITLFFCAGAIYVAHRKTEVSQLDGLAAKMPLTFLAFFVASVSIIGLPPLGGTWSKWFLMQGAVEADYVVAMAALMLSSLLSVAYLMPIVVRAAFMPLPTAKDKSSPATDARIEEAPWPCVLALLTTAAIAVLLFFYAGDLAALIDLAMPSATADQGASQ